MSSNHLLIAMTLVAGCGFAACSKTAPDDVGTDAPVATPGPTADPSLVDSPSTEPAPAPVAEEAATPVPRAPQKPNAPRIVATAKPLPPAKCSFVGSLDNIRKTIVIDGSLCDRVVLQGQIDPGVGVAVNGAKEIQIESGFSNTGNLVIRGAGAGAQTKIYGSSGVGELLVSTGHIELQDTVVVIQETGISIANTPDGKVSEAVFEATIFQGGRKALSITPPATSLASEEFQKNQPISFRDVTFSDNETAIGMGFPMKLDGAVFAQNHIGNVAQHNSICLEYYKGSNALLSSSIPITSECNINLTGSSSLNIAPGTLIKFDEGKGINISQHATLISSGKAEQPIFLTDGFDAQFDNTNEKIAGIPVGSHSWNGIVIQGDQYIQGSGNASASFAFTTIRHSGIAVRNAALAFHNSRIEVGSIGRIGYSSDVYSSKLASIQVEGPSEINLMDSIIAGSPNFAVHFWNAPETFPRLHNLLTGDSLITYTGGNPRVLEATASATDQE